MAVAGRVSITCFSRRATGELPGGENARHQGAREEGAAEALRRAKCSRLAPRPGEACGTMVEAWVPLSCAICS